MYAKKLLLPKAINEQIVLCTVAHRLEGTLLDKHLCAFSNSPQKSLNVVMSLAFGVENAP